MQNKEELIELIKDKLHGAPKETLNTLKNLINSNDRVLYDFIKTYNLNDYFENDCSTRSMSMIINPEKLFASKEVEEKTFKEVKKMIIDALEELIIEQEFLNVTGNDN